MVFGILIQLPGFDAVVDDRWIDAPTAAEISKDTPVIGVSWGKLYQLDGFFFLLCNLFMDRRPGRSGQDLHRLAKLHPLNLCQIIQSAASSDPLAPPVPFAIGNLQAVMGAGAVCIATEMHQLIWLIPAQISQQIHLPCFCNFVLRHCAPPFFSGIEKACLQKGNRLIFYRSCSFFGFSWI